MAYKDNARSSLKDSFKSVTVGSVVPVLNNWVHLEVHRDQRICKVCGLNLKSTMLNVKNKKYNCKFCCEAVCENCSEIRCFHTVLGDAQRICLACFNQAIEDKIISEATEGDLKLCMPGENRIEKENLKLIKKIAGKREEIKKKSERLAELRKNIEELVSVAVMTSVVVLPAKENKNKKVQKFETGQTMLKEIQEISQKNGVKLESYHDIIKGNNLKISQLTSELEKIHRRITGIKEKKNRGFEIVRSQILSHSGIITATRREILQLQQELDLANEKKSNCSVF